MNAQGWVLYSLLWIYLGSIMGVVLTIIRNILTSIIRSLYRKLISKGDVRLRIDPILSTFISIISGACIFSITYGAMMLMLS